MEIRSIFQTDAGANSAAGNIDFYVCFIIVLTTSFAERSTDEGTTGADLIRQADLLTDMLVSRFRIS